jgi:hypothetical protein
MLFENDKEFDLMPASPLRDRLRGFATEYAELCKKYNLTIDSCGCCNSPWIVEVNVDEGRDFIVHIENVDATDVVGAVEKFIADHNI